MIAAARDCSWVLSCLTLITANPSFAADKRLAQAQLIQKSADMSISGTFDLSCSPTIFEKLMAAPMLLARLYEVYGFSPHYKVRMQGNAIHVNDPTGIVGDLYLIEQTADRRVYLGIGALNHSLVPAFKGKMTLILTTYPKGSTLTTRVDVYIRTDSRTLGFLARTLFPLVKARVENRMTVNAHDIGTIIADVSAAPDRVAARLKKEDAATLLNLVPPRPAAMRR